MLHDVRQGYLCSYFISNRTNHIVLQLFFPKLRKRMEKSHLQLPCQTLVSFYLMHGLTLLKRNQSIDYSARGISSLEKKNTKNSVKRRSSASTQNFNLDREKGYSNIQNTF